MVSNNFRNGCEEKAVEKSRMARILQCRPVSYFRMITAYP